MNTTDLEARIAKLSETPKTLSAAIGLLATVRPILDDLKTPENTASIEQRFLSAGIAGSPPRTLAEAISRLATCRQIVADYRPKSSFGNTAMELLADVSVANYQATLDTLASEYEASTSPREKHAILAKAQELIHKKLHGRAEKIALLQEKLTATRDPQERRLIAEELIHARLAP